MKAKWLLFIYTVFFLSNSYAGDIQLLVWRPASDSPAYILPQKTGETARQAIERYRAFLFSDTGLKAVAPPTMFENGEGAVEALHDGGAKALFVANKEQDHIEDSTRYQKFQKQITGTENYLLPLGAAARLHGADREAFHQAVIKQFSGLILMGGKDWTPSTYGHEVTYAVDFNLERDQLELELIRAYVKAGKGFVFGVCRGMQGTSIALGLKMIQDIPKETTAYTPHSNNNHESFQRKTSYRILEGFLGGAQPYDMYSWHHQAVVYEANPYLTIAAISPEGITEALEFSNGKGLLIQSHPELTNSSKARKIMSGVSSMIVSTSLARSCGRTFSK
jgi:Predicted glutamine amidotransferases